MTKCNKCQALYEAYTAHLDEMIRYFENREKYRNQPMDEEWTEERRKQYNLNRIQGFKIKKDFIKQFYKEEE
jgi:hypothetical protein